MSSFKIKQPNDADVLIAGAGPAGASAATYLARAGLKVALIDQHTFPRDKVCGDFLSPIALLELQRLGVVDNPEYQHSNLIYSASVHVDGKQLVRSLIPDIPGLPTHGRVVPRIQLDAWIVEAARAAGVQIYEDWRVKSYSVDPDGVTIQVEHEGREHHLRGRVLIGADGSSSLVARQMLGKLPSSQDRIIAVRAYYENISGPSDQADLYFSSSSFPGYYWLFPTGESSANVGVGMLLETLPAATEHLPKLLDQLIEEDAAFHERLGGARRVGRVSGWPLSTYNPSTPLVADRVLLAGDAAGLINPLNGEGIQYALLSGRWAAEWILQAAPRNDFSRASLQGYADGVSHNLRYDMALAGMIVQLIRNRTLNPVWMEALRIILSRARVDPRYADIAGGVLAGMEPASSVIQSRIIAGTAQQAVMTLSMGAVKHVLGGPKHLLQVGKQTTDAGLTLATETVRNPMEYVRWGVDVALSAAELAGQMAYHMSLLADARDSIPVTPAEQPPALKLKIKAN